MKLSKAWFGNVISKSWGALFSKATPTTSTISEDEKDERAYSRALAAGMSGDYSAMQGDDPFDVTSAVNQFSTNPWVYAAISARKDAVAGIPWRVMQYVDKVDEKTGKVVKVKEAVPDSAAQKILDRPNNRYSGYEARGATVAWQDLSGDAYWEIIRDPSAKKIVGFVYLRSDCMTVIPDPKKIINGYLYGSKGVKGQRLEPSDVVHFKAFTPKCEYKGQGTIQAAARSLALDESAMRWMRDLFDHGAKPGGVLRYKDFLSDEQYSRAKSEIATWEGARKRHKIMVLEGDAQFQPDTSAPKDMEFANMREWDRREVLASTDVPPIMVGDKDNTYANAESQKDQFWSAILSSLQGIAETVKNQFLVYFDARYFLEFDTSVVPYLADLEQKHKAAVEDAELTRETKEIQANLRTVNEWRKDHGLAATAWGDLPFSAQAQAALAGMGIGVPPEQVVTETDTIEPETGTTPKTVSLGLTPSDLGTIVTVNEARASVGLPALTGAEGNMTLDEYRLKNKTAIIPEPVPEVKSMEGVKPEGASKGDPKAPSERYLKRKAARIANWNPMQRRNENKFFAAMQKFFEAQQGRVIAKLKGNATKRLSKADLTDDEFDDLFDSENENDALAEFTAGFYADMVKQAGQGAVSELKVNGVFNVSNPKVDKWLEDYKFKFADQVNTTTQDKLRAALTEGYNAGEGADDLTARVEEVFADTVRGSAARARNIARTESIHAMNAGAYAGYEQLGVEKKEWLPTQDYRTREGHAEMAGVVVDFDKPFKVPVYSQPTTANPVAEWIRDDEMMYPLDGSLGAGLDNICQCRCTVLPLPADEEE